MDKAEKFDTYAIVELFGHNQIAGKCSEQNIAGSNMLRVDVPETDHNPAFTKFLGNGAIYAINPVTEEVAKHWASSLGVAPLTAWDVRSYMLKNNLSLTSGQDTDEDQDYR